MSYKCKHCDGVVSGVITLTSPMKIKLNNEGKMLSTIPSVMQSLFSHSQIHYICENCGEEEWNLKNLAYKED